MNTFVALVILALAIWVLTALIGVFGIVLGVIIWLFLIS